MSKTGRPRTESIRGANIHIGDASRSDPTLEDLPGCDEVGGAIGCHRSNVSIIAREAVMRLQLRLVSECVALALPTWTQDAAADIVVFLIEQRIGLSLIYGEITIDDVLDMMDDSQSEGEAA